MCCRSVPRHHWRWSPVVWRSRCPQLMFTRLVTPRICWNSSPQTSTSTHLLLLLLLVELLMITVMYQRLQCPEQSPPDWTTVTTVSWARRCLTSSLTSTTSTQTRLTPLQRFHPHNLQQLTPETPGPGPAPRASLSQILQLCQQSRDLPVCSERRLPGNTRLSLVDTKQH